MAEKFLGGMNPRPSKGMQQRPVSQRSVQANSTQNRVAQNMQTRSFSMQQRPIQQRPVQSQTQSVQSEVKSSDSQARVNEFVAIMKSMVGGFANINEQILNTNVDLSAGRMSVEDRTVSFECADYLLSNGAYILMGLVMDVNFRQAFTDSVSLEISFDKYSDEDKAKIRAAMKDPKSYESKGSIVIGVTDFAPAVHNEFMRRLQSGFEALDVYADEFDATARSLTSDQRAELGFVFSNFMYLIRAFTHNDAFMSYVITVIEKVKSEVSKERNG